MIVPKSLHLNGFKPVRLPSKRELALSAGALPVASSYSGEEAAPVLGDRKADVAGEITSLSKGYKPASEDDLPDPE